MRTKRYRLPALYAVTGLGPITVVGRAGLEDMLRYDGCQIAAETTDPQGETSAVVSYPPGRRPTIARWASFGYHLRGPLPPDDVLRFSKEAV